LDPIIRLGGEQGADHTEGARITKSLASLPAQGIACRVVLHRRDIPAFSDCLRLGGARPPAY